MANYYLFERNSSPGRWIEGRRGDDTPRVDWFHWRQGAFLPATEVIPDPIHFSLQPYNPNSADDSDHMPSLLQAAVPLFSDALVQALEGCGIDNLQTYNVALKDPDNGETYTNYKAINLLGLISAADMDKSDATVHPNGPPMIDVDFDRLVLDENKLQGQLIFRLAESTNAILIHERVRDHLMEKGFNDLAFYDLDKVAL